VAIKVLPPDTRDEYGRERFRREAQTAAKLSHPNIVPLYTFGEAEGMMYFAMGYVRGESLAERLRRDGRIPPDETRRLLVQIADALDYAHRQGIVHRDIKPDNLLLDDSSGRPMLTDFGVAKAVATGRTLTEAGAAVGTPHYMSPEQAAGERQLDGRSDLYSLGIMGYQMLTGQLPFEGDSFRDIVVQHVTKEARPLKAVFPDVPEDLAVTLDRCLAKSPDARWADAGTFKAQLALEHTDDELPFELARLEGGLVYGGLAGVGGTAFMLGSEVVERLRAGSLGWELVLEGLGVLSFCFALFVGIRLLLARSARHNWADVLQAIRRPPRWWGGWWPRTWRRASDLWDRLPPELRQARGWMTLAWLPLGTGVLLWIVSAGNVDLQPFVWKNLEPILLLMGLGPGLISSAIAHRFGKKSGFASFAESSAVAMGAPTSRLSFWKNPRYSRILLPPKETRPAGRDREPQTPQQQLQAILDIARELSGPARDLGTDAVYAARQLMNSLQRAEDEIRQLSRDADPSEIASVQQRLQSMTRSGGAATGEEQQLRELAQHQLQLLERLAGRLAEARSRQLKLADLLQMLRLNMVDLRAQVARASRADDAVTSEIRHLCADIERYVSAASEVESIVTAKLDQPQPHGLDRVRP
jgi:cytochrome c556